MSLVVFICRDLRNCQYHIIIKHRRWGSDTIHIICKDQRENCQISYTYLFLGVLSIIYLLKDMRDRRGRDLMVVGFITKYAISACHYKRCEFESPSGEVYSMQHYMIKFVSNLR
jgi:hypothetical protein